MAEDHADGRVVTVSTVRDTIANIERFVARNLSSGVDHMVVFLDQGQPKVRAMLEANPDVTVVPTESGWWRGQRPAAIEPRQIANANAAITALSTLPSVEWAVHLDGDEALSFDRSALSACADQSVRFPTLEAVSQRTWRDDRPAYFKAIASPVQLRALTAMGAIDEPTLDAYYRGHVAGKTGVRPGSGLRIGIHAAYDETGAKVTSSELDDAQLLHYESWCLDDFVERWRDFAPKKARRTNHRERRKLLGLAAYSTLNHPHLDDKLRRRYVERLYDDNVADDLRALEWFGLLVASPATRTIAPRSIPRTDVEDLRAVLRAMRSIDKRAFLLEAPAGAPTAALQEAAAQLEPAHAARVREVAARASN